MFLRKNVILNEKIVNMNGFSANMNDFFTILIFYNLQKVCIFASVQRGNLATSPFPMPPKLFSPLSSSYIFPWENKWGHLFLLWF